MFGEKLKDRPGLAHELVDRVHCIEDAFSRAVLEHDSLKLDKKLTKRALKVAKQLAKLYQEAGVHMK